MKAKRSLALALPLLFLPSAAFSEGVVGTAIVVKGNVMRVSHGRTGKLAQGDKIEDGDFIISMSGGAAKLLMNDKSEMSIGSDSKIKIDAPKQGVPGDVEIAQGELRARVVKDYLSDGKASGKTKLLIKTKSATMGVRGTDFEVIFNPKNQVTSLVTFEGAVAMAKNEGDHPANTDSPKAFDAIEQHLNGDHAVTVTQGTFSSAMPQMPETSVPTRISPAQLEAMKNSEPGTAGAGGSRGGGGKGSTIPPGADAKAFMGNGAGLEKQLSTMVGGKLPDTSAESSHSGPPPEGFYDKDTGKFAPASGGFIDLKTGLYIPPPPGSAFDPNTGVYVPPASMGGFDPKSGAYVPPAGFNLDPTRGFVPQGGQGNPSTPQVMGAMPTPEGPKNGMGIVPGPCPGGSCSLPPPPACVGPQCHSLSTDPACPSCPAPPAQQATPPNKTRVKLNISVQ